jgi:hypothetical protein
MKKRILAVIALVLLFGGTTLAFGYWDNLTPDAIGEKVVVGEGVTLTVPAAINPTGQLVPTGVVMKTGDVDSYVLTYSVSLDKATLANLNLAVTISNIEIGGITTYNDAIDIVVSGITTVNNTAGDVIITITFDGEPADLAEYTAVATKDITFDITFVATVA